MLHNIIVALCDVALSNVALFDGSTLSYRTSCCCAGSYLIAIAALCNIVLL